MGESSNPRKSTKIRNRKTVVLGVFYQNVRGLKTKLKTWRNNLIVSEYRLVAATETFLDNSVEDAELVSGDWSVLRRDRNTPCGGVLLAARAPITLSRQTSLETEAGEDLWANFMWSGLSFYVCVVYIKPTSCDDVYMRWFCKVENYINKLKGNIVILGDINLNSASMNVKNYYCYFLSFCSLRETNVVMNAKGGMLDVVLVRESKDKVAVSVQAVEGLVPPDLYHPPLDIGVTTVMAPHDTRIEPSNIDPRTDWNFKRCDFNMLRNLLFNAPWSEILENNDVQSGTDKFYEIIYDIFDKCFSKKARKHSRGARYPVWFTKDIIQDVKRKLKLHSIWKHSGNSEAAYRDFSEIRTSLKIRVADAYNNYLHNVENCIISNPRGFWQHISALRSKGGFEPTVCHRGETASGIKAAEAFAEFFASVFLPDVPRLDADSANSIDNNSTSGYVNIRRFTHRDVGIAIKKLKPDSSIGPDNIPPWLLKQFHECLTVPLCHIFNRALAVGTYPTQWKLSRVTPIPKSSTKQSVEEFRPIAILSTPAKIFESILQREIYSQVEQQLCNEQHGFRKKRSVDTNLLSAVDFISSRLDCKSQVDVLYFDFRKAFDRINNDLLLAKLSKLGFAPNLLRLIADYLRDRQQFVRLGLYESQPYHTRSGVSQGSILGPLLFILMVNDLPAVVKHAQCLLYADDLKLMLEIKSENDCLLLQSDVDSVYQWSVENGMDFNPSKCNVMTFGRMLHPIEFQYKLDCDSIMRSNTIKDLGVTLDRKLTFHDHIVATTKDSFRRLGFVLRNARDFQSHNVIKLVFGALVRSKLEASSCIWNPYESTYALMLEKVQKAFLRFLYKRMYGYYPFMYPSKFLLGTLGYNSLEVRRANNQMIIMCKILRGNIDAPDLHEKLCQLYTPNNYHRARHHKLFVVPQCRTVARARSPIPRTLGALNALLDANPECDVFADGWKGLLHECLKFCEMNDKVVSSVN